MKVKDLKKILEEKLEILEELDEEAEIKKVSNTYFLGHPKYFLGIAGSYDGGYINLDTLEEDSEEEDLWD